MAERRKETASTVAPSGTGWLPPGRVAGLLREGPPVVYQLLIRLERPLPVRIAAPGAATLPAGWYVYTGSARRASASRLARHLRKEKCRRWHIDHVLTRSDARIVAIRLWPWQPGLECRVNQALLRSHGAAAPIAGFGSSDCRQRCPAHLLRCGGDLRKMERAERCCTRRRVVTIGD